jgi:hypothetical protein
MRGLLLLFLAAAAAGTIWVTAGRTRPTGTDYGPADGVTAESPGDRSFRPPQLRELDALLSSWPPAARDAARDVVAKYGMPDEAEPRRLVWNDNGPWKRTVARREARAEPLEFTAAYRVPLDRFALIAKLPGSLSAERGQEELTARATVETMALLAVNMADEALSGKRTPQDARAVYDSEASAASQGKATPHSGSLLFAEPAGRGGRP